jgi:hypothetical protein
MNNTDKKLDALIDVLGFDVEQVDVNPRKHDRYPSEPIYDYKLIKRDKPVDDEPVNHEWTVDTNTSYAFDDEHTENANRPPLGLTPKSIHDGVREEEIISTMVRYLKVGKAIPDSWLSELNTLQADRS